MKLHVQNTAHGLVPLYDADYDEKKKLRIGEVYEVAVKRPRNLPFHKKYFSLIHCAWDYLPEHTVEYFHHNIECFRKTVEIAAGWCEPVYSIARREWVETAKSIAFDKMTEDEFRELYERAKDVLYKYSLKHVTVEEFEKNLINY